ncbi:MAG TPA: ribonuclease J [Candidatus Paceibacterota bacterium]|nr:ribonuclease J [Candidatus Paceibacterota bacterium]
MIQQHSYSNTNKKNQNPRNRNYNGRSGKPTSEKSTAIAAPERRENKLPRRVSRDRNGHGRNMPRKSPLSHRSRGTKANILPVAEDAIRIIPLGGVEEVGKNMVVIENKDDIFISDAGFQFSEVETPGIDYIIPNTTYLEEHKDKIRGMFITHGHLDHIGAIPYIMEKIGNPKIYTRPLTAIMIKKRHEEFPHVPKPEIIEVEPNQSLTLGKTHVKFFSVTHSIPDSMGISIETPYGNVLLSGDLRLNHKDGVPVEEEQEVWGKIGKENNLLFIADSTNAENPGWSIPESEILKNIEKVIKDTPGRLFIGTFASQFARMVKIIEMCEKYGKKVITEGRSIKSNIEIAQRAGLLTPKKDTIIPVQEIGNYPADRIVVLATGAQGEEFAALMRMATKQHKYVTLNERDTILLSSSVIPGNELSVQRLKDELYRNGVKLITYRTSEVHASGHGNQEELAWINKMVGAKFFMPGYGYHSMLRVHAEVAERVGVPRKNIILAENGSVIDIVKGEQLVIQKEKVPAWDIFVDGFSVGDVQEVVIRDRQMLAEDGMFIVIVTLDVKTKQVKKSPDVISRGFVYLKESQELLKQARIITRKTVETRARGMKTVNFDALKRDVTESVSRYLLQKTNKHPMVIPVILSV